MNLRPKFVHLFFLYHVVNGQSQVIIIIFNCNSPMQVAMNK